MGGSNLLEASGSGFHPVNVGDSRDGNQLWIFALVLLFLALAFLWGNNNKNHQYPQGAMPHQVMPVQPMHMPPYGGYDGGHKGHHNEYQHWDISRDSNREFGEVKRNIADSAYTQTQQSDRYFHETNRNIDAQGYKNLEHQKESEVQGMRNTADVIKRIDEMERRIEADKLGDLRAQLAHEKTVNRLMPQAPVPAYWPQYPAPVQVNRHIAPIGHYEGG